MQLSVHDLRTQWYTVVYNKFALFW